MNKGWSLGWHFVGFDCRSSVSGLGNTNAVACCGSLARGGDSPRTKANRLSAIILVQGTRFLILLKCTIISIRAARALFSSFPHPYRFQDVSDAKCALR